MHQRTITKTQSKRNLTQYPLQGFILKKVKAKKIHAALPLSLHPRFCCQTPHTHANSDTHIQAYSHMHTLTNVHKGFWDRLVQSHCITSRSTCRNVMRDYMTNAGQHTLYATDDEHFLCFNCSHMDANLDRKNTLKTDKLVGVKLSRQTKEISWRSPQWKQSTIFEDSNSLPQ